MSASRAKTLSRERAKELKQKKMKKGCLARGLATLFFLFSLGLGGATYYLWGQNADLEGQLTQAKARIALDEKPGPGRHKQEKGAPAPNDLLNQAQTDANQAKQDAQSGDAIGAGEQALAAVRILAKMPKNMSDDAQKQYNSINSQVAGVKNQIAKLRDTASAEYRKLSSFGGG